MTWLEYHELTQHPVESNRQFPRRCQKLGRYQVFARDSHLDSGELKPSLLFHFVITSIHSAVPPPARD
jgi:hypothetical protein